MSKALDTGKSFVEGVLAKLPESLRDQARTIFAAAEATEAITTIGDGVLARSDYSRAMDEVRQKTSELDESIAQAQADYDRNLAWWTTNEAEFKRLKATSNGNTTAPTKPEATPAPEKKWVDEDALAQRELGAARFFAALNKLGMEHYARFGEVLDADALVASATQKRQSIHEAYQGQFGDRLAAKAKEAEDARIAKLVDERLVEERKRLAEQPYPLRGQAPSVLDVLSEEGGPAKHTVDSAVAEYERLQAARGV